MVRNRAQMSENGRQDHENERQGLENLVGKNVSASVRSLRGLAPGTTIILPNPWLLGVTLHKFLSTPARSKPIEKTYKVGPQAGTWHHCLHPPGLKISGTIIPGPNP